MAAGKFSIIGSSGELETYPDYFGSVTQEQVQEAQAIENDIIKAKNIVYLGFYAIAEMLDRFEAEKLYKARGYERFKDWLESPEIEISYRVAQDLIRIQREIVPMMQAELGLSTEEVREKLLHAGVSKVRALLPLASEQSDHENFYTLLDDAPSLTWRDLRKEMDRARGKEERIEDGYAPMFTSKILINRTPQNKVVIQITGSDGNSIEPVGQVTMHEDWVARWINRIPERQK